MKLNKRKIVYGISILLLFISILIIASVKWSYEYFGKCTMTQLLFHIFSPLNGTETGIIFSWLQEVLLLSIMVIVGLIVCVFGVCKAFPKVKAFVVKYGLFINIGAFVLSIAMIISSVYYVDQSFSGVRYFKNRLKISSIYEDKYIDPRNGELTFPKEKRNLIYIYLESMENTYFNVQDGGYSQHNLMNDMKELAEQNVNFSHTDGIGGWQTTVGTGWTFAGMISQTAGIPLTSHEIESNSYDKLEKMLPGAYSLGEILEKNGYTNYLLLGQDSKFAGTNRLFTEHGNYHISDYYTAKKEGRIGKDYHVWWGYEDRKLFEFAKEDITNLSKEEPFNFTIVTADPHTPGGYICPDCPKQYDRYSNVIACQSKKVGDFIHWVQQQDFYENTTIVISGDHLSMYGEYFKNIPANYQRTVTNIIINSVKEPVKEKNRKFTSMDLFPTTLAAMGVEIKGECLGLGTNLFSTKQTILEEMGLDKYNTLLEMKSKYYNSYILGQ